MKLTLEENRRRIKRNRKLQESKKRSLRESFDWSEVVTAKSPSGNYEYEVLPVYRGEQLVTLVDKRNGKKSKMYLGDAAESFDLYDEYDNLVSSADEYWYDDDDNSKYVYEESKKSCKKCEKRFPMKEAHKITDDKLIVNYDIDKYIHLMKEEGDIVGIGKYAVEYIDYMDAFRVFDPKYPSQAVAYLDEDALIDDFLDGRFDESYKKHKSLMKESTYSKKDIQRNPALKYSQPIKEDKRDTFLAKDPGDEMGWHSHGMYNMFDRETTVAGFVQKNWYKLKQMIDSEDYTLQDMFDLLKTWCDEMLPKMGRQDREKARELAYVLPNRVHSKLKLGEILFNYYLGAGFDYNKNKKYRY